MEEEEREELQVFDEKAQSFTCKRFVKWPVNVSTNLLFKNRYNSIGLLNLILHQSEY